MNNTAQVTFAGNIQQGFVNNVVVGPNPPPINLVKNNTGTFTLAPGGGNSYAGTTTINGGTLQAGATNAFATNSTTIVNSAGTLDIGIGNQSAGFNCNIGPLTINGGTVNVGAATLTLTSSGAGNADITATSVGSSAAKISAYSFANVVGSVALGANRSLIVNAGTGPGAPAFDLTCSANITGVGFSLTKLGNGSAQLSGPNRTF